MDNKSKFLEALCINELINNDEMMSEIQLTFLCGLIYEYKPQKILEIGVAYGGTTCVILECLKRLAYPVEMHSIDIAEDCKFDITKKTGYKVAERFPEIPSNIDFSMHLGTILPQIIENIGKDIDFVILDTAHILPGEILDYIAVLPFMHVGSVVVLHDLLLHQLGSEISICTRALYDSVVAHKIAAEHTDDEIDAPNIGAFEIIEDSYKYIENCFSSLFLPWGYDLDEGMELAYRNIYRKYYEKALVDLYERALSINRRRFAQELSDQSKIKLSLACLNQFIEQNDRILLFGAGDYAQKMTAYLECFGKRVEAYLISDYAQIKDCKIKNKVFHLSEFMQNKAEYSLIIAVYDVDNIKLSVDLSGYKNIYPGDNDDFGGVIKLFTTLKSIW